MKTLEHEGTTYMHNGRVVTIINSHGMITLSRYQLKVALDFSEDIENP